MIVLKLFVLLIGFCAGMILATVGVRSFSPVWNGLIGRYVSWILRTYREIGQEMSIPAARRLVTISLFTPPALVVALSAWPLMLVAIPGGLLIPYGWVRRHRTQHLEKMDGQLVDALILMANSMKSGLSLLQAVEMVATELKPPIAGQFETVLREVQLGRSIDEALIGMTERVPLPDLEIAVHSIVTLRETGGNLAETFMTVANTIVERKKVEGKIGAVTAQGLYQGFGMCAMPFILVALFYFMNPELTSLLFTTPLGWVIWLIVIVMDGLGMWAIMKVVKVDV
jgi:tight adherence protein B